MFHDSRLIRVVKVGGSLFEFDQAPENVRRWIVCQEPATNVLIAGGGRTVDSVRKLQKQLAIDDSAAHWMAIEMLDVTSRILANWLPDYEIVNKVADIIRSKGEEDFVFEPVNWLRHKSKLPASWDATSDSIAAEIAASIRSYERRVELVLLKSCLPDARCMHSLSALEGFGIVDDCFIHIASAMDVVRIVDLRDKHFQTIEFCLELENRPSR